MALHSLDAPRMESLTTFYHTSKKNVYSFLLLAKNAKKISNMKKTQGPRVLGETF